MPAAGASEGVDQREEIADVDVGADSTRIDRAFKVEEAALGEALGLRAIAEGLTRDDIPSGTTPISGCGRRNAYTKRWSMTRSSGKCRHS